MTFAQTLSLRLTVQNRAAHPIIFEEALHSYFAVSDITAVAISGLGGTTYIDKTEGARRKPQSAAARHDRGGNRQRLSRHAGARNPRSQVAPPHNH